MYSRVLKKTLLSLIVLTTISGCSVFPKMPWGDEEKPVAPVVTVKTVEVPVPIIHPAMPRAITLKNPEWFVVSSKNLEEFLAEMELRNGGQLVFTAMTIDDYEIMAHNVQEIRRYINQLKEVVIYYRTMTDKKPEQPKTEEVK